jgi:hypothetical protein
VFDHNIFHFLLLISRFVHRTLYNINFSEIHKSQHNWSPFKLTGILIKLLREQSLCLCSRNQLYTYLYLLSTSPEGGFVATSTPPSPNRQRDNGHDRKEGQVAKVQVLGVGQRIRARQDVALPIPLRLKSIRRPRMAGSMAQQGNIWLEHNSPTALRAVVR